MTMKRLSTALLATGLWLIATGAWTYWQSRDSNYNVSIGGVVAPTKKGNCAIMPGLPKACSDTVAFVPSPMQF